MASAMEINKILVCGSGYCCLLAGSLIIVASIGLLCCYLISWHVSAVHTTLDVA